MGIRLRRRPGMLMPAMEDTAACKGMDTELFFIGEKAPQAKAVCGFCPVMERCKEWGIRHEEFGVWGGMDEYERRAVRRADARLRLNQGLK